MFFPNCLIKTKDKTKPAKSPAEREKDCMNAGTIVGYVTQPNGSPVSGAEIWISPSGEFSREAESKFAARTDARGYFQLNFKGAGIAEVAGIGGSLNVSVGADKGARTDSKNGGSRYRVTGYLINETLKPDA